MKDILKTSENVGLIEKAPVIHRKPELDLVLGQIDLRIEKPRLEGGILNVVGLAGMGKSTFIKETLLPKLSKSYPKVAVADIDLDMETTALRYDTAHGKALLAFDLINRLSGSTNISVEEMLKKNRHEALAKWTFVQSLLKEMDLSSTEELASSILEDDLATVFREYVFQTVHATRSPALISLDSYDQVSDTENRWIQNKLMAPTLDDSGMVIWVISDRNSMGPQSRVVANNIEVVELSPLSQTDVSRLVMSESGTELVSSRVFEVTGGHPEAVDLIIKATENSVASEFEHRSAETISKMLNSDRYLGGYDAQLAKQITALSELDSFDLSLLMHGAGGVNEALNRATELKRTGLIQQTGSKYHVVEPFRTLVRSSHF